MSNHPCNNHHENDLSLFALGIQKSHTISTCFCKLAQRWTFSTAPCLSAFFSAQKPETVWKNRWRPHRTLVVNEHSYGSNPWKKGHLPMKKMVMFHRLISLLQGKGKQIYAGNGGRNSAMTSSSRRDQTRSNWWNPERMHGFHTLFMASIAFHSHGKKIYQRLLNIVIMTYHDSSIQWHFSPSIENGTW